MGRTEYSSSVLSCEALGAQPGPADVRVHSQVEFTPLAVPVLRAAGRRPVIPAAGWGVLICSLIPPPFLRWSMETISSFAMLDRCQLLNRGHEF